MIYRNKNRNKQENIKQEAYVPEYQRLEKTPIALPVSREEFRKPPTKVTPQVPPQVKINSGQDVSPAWMQSRIPAAIIQPKQTETVEYSVKNSFYDEPLASQAVSDFSLEKVEEINEEEVELPGSKIHYENNELQKADLCSIKTGEFIFMYDNEVIASGTMEEIQSVIEEILGSGDYNISVEKIVILKKMNFYTGVIISE